MVMLTKRIPANQASELEDGDVTAELPHEIVAMLVSHSEDEEFDGFSYVLTAF